MRNVGGLHDLFVHLIEHLYALCDLLERLVDIGCCMSASMQSVIGESFVAVADAYPAACAPPSSLFELRHLLFVPEVCHCCSIGITWVREKGRTNNE